MRLLLRLLRTAVDWLLRRYTVAMWPLLGARPVENRLEEALAFAQLLQLNPLVRGVRLGNIAGTAMMLCTPARWNWPASVP